MRREARARRAALTEDEREAAAIGLSGNALTLPLPSHAVVAGYWPMGDELDTRPLLHLLHGTRHAIGLPVTGPKRTPLTFRLWSPDQPLFAGRLGTLVPGTDQPEVAPSAVLVPLLAFDRRGGRLGYGGGYYDRTLGLLRARGHVIAIGIAFAIQEVATVPTGPFDRPLDWVLTEREAIPIPPA